MGDPEREPLGLYVPVVMLELLEAYHNSDLSIAAKTLFGYQGSDVISGMQGVLLPRSSTPSRSAGAGSL